MPVVPLQSDSKYYNSEVKASDSYIVPSYAVPTTLFPAFVLPTFTETLLPFKVRLVPAVYVVLLSVHGTLTYI
mgnify:FL=1